MSINKLYSRLHHEKNNILSNWVSVNSRVVSPVSNRSDLFYCKSCVKRVVHPHQTRWSRWHQKPFWNGLALTPISSVFAQHGFSFRGPNPIKESRCVSAGAKGNEFAICTSSAFLQGKLSNMGHGTWFSVTSPSALLVDYASTNQPKCLQNPCGRHVLYVVSHGVYTPLPLLQAWWFIYWNNKELLQGQYLWGAIQVSCNALQSDHINTGARGEKYSKGNMATQTITNWKEKKRKSMLCRCQPRLVWTRCRREDNSSRVKQFSLQSCGCKILYHWRVMTYPVGLT